MVLAWFVLRQMSYAPAELGGLSSDSRPHDAASIYFGPRRSLAVLPFTDRSGEQDQPWLAQGLPRELIRRLAAEESVQVTAPTSAFFFGNGSGKPEVIAQRLQVSYLLLGEAALRDSTLLLSVELHDARREAIAWQGAWETDLEQTDTLISEVLSAVRAELGVSGAAAVEALPQDRQAWLHYLQGRYLLGPPAMGEVIAAERKFRAALELQPDYSRAWQGLAESFLAGSPPNLENAEAALFRAFESEPQAPDALGLLSYMQRNFAWDWPQATESALLALEGRPGDARLMVLASRALFSLGRFEEAESHLLDSIKRDPVNLATRLSLGLAQEFKGDLDAALASYRVLLGLNPEFPAAHAFRARIKVLQDKPDSAMKESDEEPDAFWKDYSRALALIARDDLGEAASLLERIAREQGESASFQLAELNASAGNTEQAFEWLARALERKDGGLAGVGGNRLLHRLHGDPRWNELLTRMRLSLDGYDSSD